VILDLFLRVIYLGAVADPYKPRGTSVTPGKLKINRIKSNRFTKSHYEKFLCYPLESGLWIGLGLLAQFVNIKKRSLIIDPLIRNAC
jgi:hypothetical protein